MTESKHPKRGAGRVQMADLARIAGVSKATVSRALADSPLIKAETRHRIQQLAREHHYAVNLGARNLRLQRNNTVAVVVPYEGKTHQQLSDPFFLTMIGALADALVERGHEMLLTRVDAENLEDCQQVVHSGRAIGLVIIGQWHHHERLNAMAAGGFPMVVWGATLGAEQRYLCVGGDNIAGGRLAAEHLLAQRRSRILFLGNSQLPEVAQRWQGHCEALVKAGLQPVGELLVDTPFDPVEAARRLGELLDRGLRFDAVQACSDLLALTAIQVLRARGLRVPQDVAVIGYDDMSLAALANPPLSSVHQPVREAGEMLASCLMELLDGRLPRPVTLPVHLVERRSSVAAAPARVGSDALA